MVTTSISWDKTMHNYIYNPCFTTVFSDGFECGKANCVSHLYVPTPGTDPRLLHQSLGVGIAAGCPKEMVHRLTIPSVGLVLLANHL